MERLDLKDITNSSLLVGGKVKVNICRMDITDRQEHMLMNFMSKGEGSPQDNVTSKLLEKGGPSFKAAYAEMSALEAGEIAAIGGFRLRCREVLFCYCPPYQYERLSKQNYKNVVSKCLVKTASSRCRSVSIPVGSIPSRYPTELVARWLLEVIHDHCELHRRSSLQTVTVVIPPDHLNTQQEFDDIMYELMPSRIADKILSDVTTGGMLIGGKVQLSIVDGDITKSTDEVIVNSTTRDLDLSKGRVAPALARKAGPQLQQACTKAAPLEIGDVVETSGYQLPGKVMHCNLSKYEDDEDTKMKLKGVVSKCLMKVATGWLSSISFSALGTGNLSYPPELVAKWMIEAIIDHCDLYARSSLKSVNIVLYARDQTTKKGFVAYMRSLIYKEVSDTHLLIYNRLHFDVIWDDLSTSIEDVVAVSSKEVDKTTQSIKQKCGEMFNEARFVILPLGEGRVEATLSYDMPCREILHFTCPRWTEDGGEGLKAMVKCCLAKAALSGYRSIAFPAIGVEVEKYPEKVSCAAMVKAVEEYCEDNSHSLLRTVKLYVDPELTTNDQREEVRWCMRLLGCKKVSDGYTFAHGTRMTVVKGDLADTQVDVIVNSTGSHMALSGGKEALSLLNKAGQALKEECEKHKDIISGEIVMTEGFGLPCDNVLHVCCPSRWRSGETEKIVRELVFKCLCWANDMKAGSLALPAIGTGLLNYPSQPVARCIVHAVSDFARVYPRSTVKDIFLVLFHSDTSTIDKFGMALGLDLSEIKVQSPSDMTSTISSGKIVVDLPSPWQKPVSEYREFAVIQGTNEWGDVKKDFDKTICRKGVRILEVLRIQNPEMFSLYDVKKKSVARKLNKQEHEVETAPLWHGTAEASVSQITRTKFDRSRAGENKKLGAGTYFSTSAKYSSNSSFSPPNAKGERFMILARVITGDYCLGNSNMTTATQYKEGSTYEQYDSVVDDINEPTMYAVFHDASAYPEYVIKYQY